MLYDVLLRFLLFLDPSIGLNYGITTQHSIAFPKEVHSSYFNCVCNNNGACDDQDIQAIKDYFGKTEFVWAINAQDRASADVVERDGFVQVDQFPAMKCDLSLLEYEDIYNVYKIDFCDEKVKEDWIEVCQKVFPISYKDRLDVISYLVKSLYDSSLLSLYIVYENEMPVAAGMMLEHQDLVTLHSIAVVPEARGKGFAKNLVRKALYDARQKGCTWAILFATDMGKPLYEKLGFKEYAMYSVYLQSKYYSKKYHNHFFI